MASTNANAPGKQQLTGNITLKILYLKYKKVKRNENLTSAWSNLYNQVFKWHIHKKPYFFFWSSNAQCCGTFTTQEKSHIELLSILDQEVYNMYLGLFATKIPATGLELCALLLPGARLLLHRKRKTLSLIISSVDECVLNGPYQIYRYYKGSSSLTVNPADPSWLNTTKSSWWTLIS